MLTTYAPIDIPYDRRLMIQSLMLCGIGLLAGCLLMLAFVPLIHERAVRLTKRQMTEATPMTMTEIQADKDQLRAEFAMSVRRLEIGMEDMREKAMARSADKQNAEISRLQVELDKQTAVILTMRAREDVRRSVVRRVIKILLYIFVRSKRRPASVPQLRQEHQPRWHAPEPDQSQLAARAAAIAAINLKRRRAVSNRY